MAIMKSFLISLFFLVSMSFTAASIQAQTKKNTAPKKTVATKPKAKTTTDTQVLDASSQPVKDTVKPPPPPPPPPADPFAFDSIKPSLRPDDPAEISLNKERKPLAYDYISSDHKWYRELVWREIDIREKMNLTFRYSAETDEGNQRFINIVLNAVSRAKNPITAFDPIDDRFTTPMTREQVGKAILPAGPDSVSVPDLVNDPSGTLGLRKSVPNKKIFNPDDILKFRIKEEWIFDKEASRMVVRIKGIAPIKQFKDENGEIKGEGALFWIWYEDLRPDLALHDVYVARNLGAKMTWEEIFESRYFSSYIIKSSIDNPYDKYLKEIFGDSILVLLEGDNIKNKIHNFEQNLWSY